MSLSIRTKLFLTLLTATALVVVGMLVFTRWSFERGLVEFAQARQQEAMSALNVENALRSKLIGGAYRGGCHHEEVRVSCVARWVGQSDSRPTRGA